MIKVIMTILIVSNIFAVEISHHKFDGNLFNEINNKFDGLKKSNISFVSDRNENENSALLFKGGYIEVPGFKNFNFGNELTVSLWMRRDGISGYQGIISNGYYTQGSFEIRMGREYGGTYLFAKVNGDFDSPYIVNKNIINITKWHHIAYVVSVNSTKLYIDGILVNNSFKNDGHINIKNKSIIIGANGSALENFIGALDDVRIFNNALTLEEIINIKDNKNDDIVLQISTDIENPSLQIGEGLAVNVDLTNNINVDTLLHHWTTLTLPSNKQLSHRLGEEIVVLSNSNKIFNKYINIQSWYPLGNYKYNYFLMTKDYKIYSKSVSFTVE